MITRARILIIVATAALATGCGTTPDRAPVPDDDPRIPRAYRADYADGTDQTVCLTAYDDVRSIAGPGVTMLLRKPADDPGCWGMVRAANGRWIPPTGDDDVPSAPTPTPVPTRLPVTG